MGFGGPVITAGLLTFAGWRMIFVIPAPDHRTRARRRLADAPVRLRDRPQRARDGHSIGIALITGLVAASLFAVSQVGVRWWLGRCRLSVAIACSVGVLGAFGPCRRSRSSPAPTSPDSRLSGSMSRRACPRRRARGGQLPPALHADHTRPFRVVRSVLRRCSSPSDGPRQRSSSAACSDDGTKPTRSCSDRASCCRPP